MENSQKGVSLRQKLIILIGFILFSNLFFFHPPGFLGFVFYAFGLFTFLWLIFSQNIPPKSRSLILFFNIAIISLYSLSVITQISIFPSLLARLSILFTLSLFVYTTSHKLPFVRNLLDLIISPFRNISSYLEGLGKAIVESITPDSALWQSLTFREFGKAKSLIPYLIGAIIGIPVLFIFTSLLSADPAFGSFVNNISKFISSWFKGDFWVNLSQRGVISLFLFAALFPLLFFLPKDGNPSRILDKFSFSKQITVVITFIVVLLGTFIVIQWPYVFVNVPFETHLSQFGVNTYSEYVKRGFGEFIFVTLLVYALLWLGLIVKRNSPSKKILSWIQYILFAEFFIFLLSIFRRVYLYQSYHGWSLGRIYGTFLLLWILFVTITLFLRHISSRRYALIETLFTAIFIGTISLINAENFIATTHPPTVNKRIDYIYLSRMSPDGYTGWQMAYDYAKNVLLDTSYPETAIIELEDRQRIAYAGYVTRRLIAHYHALEEKYASNDEKNKYYQTILENQKELLIPIQNALEQTRHPQPPVPVSIQSLDGTSVTIFPTPTPYLESDTTYEYQFTTERKKTIDQALQKLSSCKTCTQEVGSIFYMDYLFSPSTFYPSNVHWVYGLHTFDPSPNGKKVEKSSLDRLFAFNASDHAAFEKIKKDIPLDTLLALQNKYLELYQQIGHQPEKQRTYEMDISTNSPFLGSF